MTPNDWIGIGFMLLGLALVIAIDITKNKKDDE